MCVIEGHSQSHGTRRFSIKPCRQNVMFILCRQGSGSACRSVFGGFVKWERGEREDGQDSVAVQVCYGV